MSNHSISDLTGSYLDVKCKVGAEMEVTKLADDVRVGVHRQLVGQASAGGGGLRVGFVEVPRARAGANVINKTFYGRNV